MCTDHPTFFGSCGYGCHPFFHKRGVVRFKSATPGRQHGVSLFVVLIILLLSLIIVLSGLAVANLNESLVGNQSDAQRAYGAAQALLDAAQLDIRLNGGHCNATVLGGAGTNPDILTGAPLMATPCVLRYPRYGQEQADIDYGKLNQIIGIDACSGSTGFIGVCISSSPISSKFNTQYIDNGDNTGNAAEQWNVGAGYYNDYTKIILNNNKTVSDNNANWGGSAHAGSGAGFAASLELNDTGLNNPKNFKGVYWVEIFRYQNTTGLLGNCNNIPIPDGEYPYIFRITAKAQGLKAGTVSILRTYYVPYPASIKVNSNCGAVSTNS
jgi:Tfp pilus assembly protein PilX